jgi:AcrR family transcriptional regulator
MSRLPAAERREQLLDCAAELFSRHGYARATTAELAKAAGVTEPIIYRHFDSKRGLFVALIERTGRQTLAAWEQHLADASDPGERLKRLLSENPMVTGASREAYRVFLQAITEVDDPEIHRAVSEHLGSVHAFLSRELAAAQERKRVTDRISPEIIAWLLIDIGLGYGVADALRVPGHGADSAGNRAKDIIERMLVRRGPDGRAGA